jgi:hypothetical protein
MQSLICSRALFQGECDAVIAVLEGELANVRARTAETETDLTAQVRELQAVVEQLTAAAADAEARVEEAGALLLAMAGTRRTAPRLLCPCSPPVVHAVWET